MAQCDNCNKHEHLCKTNQYAFSYVGNCTAAPYMITKNSIIIKEWAKSHGYYAYGFGEQFTGGGGMKEMLAWLKKAAEYGKEQNTGTFDVDVPTEDFITSDKMNEIINTCHIFSSFHTSLTPQKDRVIYASEFADFFQQVRTIKLSGVACETCDATCEGEYCCDWCWDW